MLDLFYWFGPRLSLAPMIERVFGPSAASLEVSADALQAYEETREGLLQVGESFNLFALLSSHYPGIPSLMSGREGLGPVVGVDGVWSAVALALLLVVAGIGLASAYYVSVARAVTGSVDTSAEISDRAWRLWGRLLTFVLLLIGASLLLGVPLGVIFLLLGSGNPAVLGFMASFVWVAALWVQFYLFFVVDAMVISDVGPRRAMLNSVAIVKFYTRSTLGLVALIWIVMLGMPVIWDALAQNPLGTAVGILGNAFLLTGLAVASMTYYRDRIAVLAARAMSGE